MPSVRSTPLVVPGYVRHVSSDRTLCIQLLGCVAGKNEEPDAAVDAVGSPLLLLLVCRASHLVDQRHNTLRASMVELLTWRSPISRQTLAEAVFPVAVDALHHVANQTEDKYPFVRRLHLE